MYSSFRSLFLLFVFVLSLSACGGGGGGGSSGSAPAAPPTGVSNGGSAGGGGTGGETTGGETTGGETTGGETTGGETTGGETTGGETPDGGTSDDGSTTGSAGTATPDAVLTENEGQVLLGPVVDALVEVFSLELLSNVPVCVVYSTSADNPSGPGVLNLDDCPIVPDSLYLLVAHGGRDIDVDDDGIVDDVPTQKVGALRAIMRGQEITEGGFRMTLVTELAFQSITQELLGSGEGQKILSRLNGVAKRLLTEDLNGDAVIDYADLLYFSPRENADALVGGNTELMDEILLSILEGKRSVLTSLSRQLLLGSLGSFTYADLLPPKIDGYRNFLITGIHVEGNTLIAVGLEVDSPLNNLKVLIVDIQDLETPVLKGYLDFTDFPEDPQRSGFEFVVEGDYIYLVSRGNGLMVVDMTNVSALTAEWVITGEDFTGIKAGPEGYLFVSTWSLDLTQKSLSTLDITNPAVPVIAGVLGNFLANEMLYRPGQLIVYGSCGLCVLDASNPGNLQLSGAIALPTGSGDRLAEKDGIVYLPYHGSSLQGVFQIDIRDPENIEVIDSLAGMGFVNQVLIQDDYIFMSASTAWNSWMLATFTLGDSNQLLLSDSRSSPQGFSLDSDSERVFISGTAEFTVYNINSFGNVTSHTSVVHTPGTANKVLSNGDFLFVADSSKLLAFDIADLDSEPVYLRQLPTIDTILDIKIANGLAYMANASEGLVIADISNPAYTLTKVGQNAKVSEVLEINPDTMEEEVNGRREIDQVVLWNNFAFLSGGGMLAKVDVSNRYQPIMKWIVKARYFTDLEVNDNFLWGTDGSLLLGYNLDQEGELLAPDFIVNYPGSALRIADDVAYIASISSGLALVGVGNPSSPVIYGEQVGLGRGNAVWVSDGNAFIANEFGSVDVYDTSDLTNPEYLGSYDIHGTVKDVLVKDGKLITVNGLSLIIDPIYNLNEIFE